MSASSTSIQDILNSILSSSSTEYSATQHSGSGINTDQAPNACKTLSVKFAVPADRRVLKSKQWLRIKQPFD